MKRKRQTQTTEAHIVVDCFRLSPSPPPGLGLAPYGGSTGFLSGLAGRDGHKGVMSYIARSLTVRFVACLRDWAFCRAHIDSWSAAHPLWRCWVNIEVGVSMAILLNNTSAVTTVRWHSSNDGDVCV